jgi:hypothetical protein
MVCIWEDECGGLAQLAQGTDQMGCDNWTSEVARLVYKTAYPQTNTRISNYIKENIRKLYEVLRTVEHPLIKVKGPQELKLGGGAGLM